MWSCCSKRDLIGGSVPLGAGFKVSEPHTRPSDSLSLAVSCCGTLSSFSKTMAACACYASCIDYNGLLLTIEQFFTRLVLPIQILGSLSISFSFFLWWFTVFTVKVFCPLDRFIPTFLRQLWVWFPLWFLSQCSCFWYIGRLLISVDTANYTLLKVIKKLLVETQHF